MEKEKNNSITRDCLPGVADAGTLIQVVEKIIARHQQLGPSSPLNPGQIADLNYKVAHARIKHEEGLKYQRLMQSAWQERDRLLDLEKGELGTFSRCVREVRHQILNAFPMDGKELERWGISDSAL
jgi:hypothetical protein